MGVFTIIFHLGTMSEVTEEEASVFMKEFEALIEDIDAVGIFLHNFMLTLPMFLPGLGVVWGMFAAASTGWAFAAIVSLTPELGQVSPLAILYLTPFGIMEVTAYSIAISRSYILIWALFKKTGMRSLVIPTVAEVGISAGLLLAGGFVEYYMISLVMEDDLAMPGF